MPTSSWSTRLSAVLHASTSNRYPTPSRNPTKFSHPEGSIWRHVVSFCVYSDLGGHGIKYDISGSSRANVFRLGLGVRRFVRIEYVGLSGVVLYEFPPTHSFAGSEDSFLETNITQQQQDETLALTLQRIFGDHSNTSDFGMDVDELLDMIDAKVIYFPSYACTSFMIGHAMTASLLKRPAVQPRPAREGFFVYSGDDSVLDLQEHLPSSSNVSIEPPVCPIQQLTTSNSEPSLALASSGSGCDLQSHETFFCPSSSEDYILQQLLPSHSEIQLSKTISQENIGLSLSYAQETHDTKFILHKNDPHATLCIRTSILPLSAAIISERGGKDQLINSEQEARRSGGRNSVTTESIVLENIDQYEDDECGDSTMSTLESVGPCTPPMGCSNFCGSKRESSWTESFLEFCRAAQEERMIGVI